MGQDPLRQCVLWAASLHSASYYYSVSPRPLHLWLSRCRGPLSLAHHGSAGHPSRAPSRLPLSSPPLPPGGTRTAGSPAAPPRALPHPVSRDDFGSRALETNAVAFTSSEAALVLFLDLTGSVLYQVLLYSTRIFQAPHLCFSVCSGPLCTGRWATESLRWGRG